MKHFVYIIYSKSATKYYVGYTNTSVEERLIKHSTGYYENAYTKKIKDWVLFYSITCKSEKQAINIERHIKRMKSKKYIENLKKYAEIEEKLLKRYDTIDKS